MAWILYLYPLSPVFRNELIYLSFLYDRERFEMCRKFLVWGNNLHRLTRPFSTYFRQIGLKELVQV